MARRNGNGPFDEPGTTGRAVVVRDLRPTDLDSVTRIDERRSGRSRREYYARKLEDAIRESGVRISLAAESDGCFAGFLLGRLYYGEFGIPEPVAILDSIGVDPDFARLGVGAALLSQLEANMRALGIQTLQTEVDWSHQTLIAFLAASGFRPAPILTLQKDLTSRPSPLA